MRAHNRRIYRDDLAIVPLGVQRVAARYRWDVVDRPAEGDVTTAPSLVTLEELGLEHLRPEPADPTPEPSE
jgi:hypothetical protein